MAFLSALWLPILLSAVGVFIVSSLVHMVLKYHNSDYSKLPSEDEVLAALRPFDLPPADYMLPHCTDMKAMSDPAYLEKLNQGPVGMFTVFPKGPPSIGPQLGQWFVYCLVVSAIVAWVAFKTLLPGTGFGGVLCVVGVMAFLGYGLGDVPMSIWYKRQWSSTAKHVFDGVLYALTTGAVFGWLWPGVG